MNESESSKEKKWMAKNKNFRMKFKRGQMKSRTKCLHFYLLPKKQRGVLCGWTTKCNRNEMRQNVVCCPQCSRSNAEPVNTLIGEEIIKVEDEIKFDNPMTFS